MCPDNARIDNEQEFPADSAGRFVEKVGKKRISRRKQVAREKDWVRKTNAEFLLQMIHEGITERCR